MCVSVSLSVHACEYQCTIWTSIQKYIVMSVKLTHIHYFQMSCSSKNKVAIQIAQAVLFLHSAKPPTVHLDIKPANILVSMRVLSEAMYM